MLMSAAFSKPWAWWILLPGVMAVGCTAREPFYPVEGTVLHKGEAASGVVVTFHPKDGDPITAIRSTGFTDAEGKFTLSTGKNNGSPAGEYVVTFLWPKEVGGKKAPKAFDTNMSVETVDGFGGAYVDATKSTFKAEVKRSETKLEPFRLE